MVSLPSLTIASLLKRPTRPVFLLGAGCSVRSGVPTADTLVGQIAKWGYCVANARNMDDPSVVRTDWWPWLQKQAWFRHELPLSDQYPTAVEAVLRPQEDRKTFFRRILNPGLPPSRGYQVLAQLLARRLFLTALTTNFDQLLASACRSTAAVHHIEEIRTPSDFRLISTSPEYPQIVYLHGSVDHYTDQNIEEETRRLNSELVEKIYPLLRDHPLVVVGYRGAEASVMQHLLFEQVDRCAGYRRGIYWCHRGNDSPMAGAPLLAQLSASLGSNFSFVQIAGFDELMVEISHQLPELLAQTPAVQSPVPALPPQQTVHDLQPTDMPFDQIDHALLRAKLIAYCDAVRLPVPVLGTDEALIAAMAERNLALRQNERWSLTQGGRLLFTRNVASQLPSARVEVEIRGESSWVSGILQAGAAGLPKEHAETIWVEGNLWVQLEALMTLLARVNRPFRLKGQASREIYPYPPLALKEIATNLLAHRDYEQNTPSRIKITAEKIVFENPGGLTDHVRGQLQDRDMQAVIQASARGIKGYRNPVIADFFFSAGAMDKEGSGLPDVVSETANNLNSLSFGPIAGNSLFKVEIGARAEALAIDPKTRTSRVVQREVRFSPNLLSVLSWPEKIWRIPAQVPRSELRNLREGGAPPFCQIGDALWSFASPDSEIAAPFLYFTSNAAITAHDTAQFLADEATVTAVPWLLNSALEQHLRKLSLKYRFTQSSVRAYFAADGESARSISYRGLFKQATRTVTKPILSRTSNAVLHWEHKAVGLRFERFGKSWALSMLPTYVFTKDGAETWIDAHQIGPRTTRRTAHDYNPTVLHSLVFWSRVLANGDESVFSMSLSNTSNAGNTPEAHSRIDIAALVPIVTFEEQNEIASGLGEPGSLADLEMADSDSEPDEEDLTAASDIQDGDEVPYVS